MSVWCQCSHCGVAVAGHLILSYWQLDSVRVFIEDDDESVKTVHMEWCQGHDSQVFSGSKQKIDPKLLRHSYDFRFCRVDTVLFLELRDVV